jgi:ribosome-associated protein
MTKPHTASPDGETFACHVARLIADSKCEDVLVLDLRGLSPITDFFVIGTGTSERQLRSVAREVHELAAIEGQSLVRSQGNEAAHWVVVDCVDVMVHLFEQQVRPYYDLESLWADAKEIRWQTRTKPGQFARLGQKTATE